MIPKRQKALPLVESPRSVVLRIHHHGEGRDLVANSTTERIREQETAIAFALILPVHGKSTQQSRWHERRSLQAARHVGGKFGELHGRCGQRVIAADGTIGEDKHERRRDVLAGFLSGLRSKIAIERFDAADESAAIVLRPKNLDAYAFEQVHRESEAGRRAVAAHGVAKTIVDGLGIE